MRRATLCVYDDYVGHNQVTVSSTMLFSLMGRADRFAVHAIVDDVSLTGTSPGTFDVFVEGSSDGDNWVQRNGNATTIGHGDISLTGIGTAGVQAMWSDGALQLGSVSNATGPLLPYVRVRVSLTLMTAHVVVHATFRD